MSRRPRIAFFDYPDVFEDFYPHYGVDQQTFATTWSHSGNHEFVRLLQKEVGDVTWYCLSLAPEVDESVHQYTGCTIRFFASSLLHRLLWKGFYLPQASWRWRSAYPLFATCASYAAMLSWALLAALLRDRPDVIFVQDYANGKFDELVAFSKLMGVPIVAYHAGSRPHGYIGKPLKALTIRQADALVVSSARERDFVVQRYGAAPGRVEVVLTPISTALYRPMPRDEACRAAGLDPSRRYFVFIGRLQDEVKRVSVLVRAFAEVAPEHSEVDLVVCGVGADSAALQALAAAAAPGRVRFTGWIADDAKKVALLNAAAALVLPSRKEGFPSVVGEALACGTPVVATDVGGISEVIEDGVTGYLMRVDDPPALAAALRRVLADGARSMRAAARAVAERRLAEDVVAEQLRACIGRVTHV